MFSALGGSVTTFLAFVVALSVIVSVHEYGHYIVGRWSGIDAEVFSLGFGPVVFSWVDKRGTRWQLAALPFGGYVKFVGDANAASVGSDAAVAPARNTMEGAPLWARAATVSAGPIFNFVLSILIFAGIAMFNGSPREPLTVGELNNVPYEVGLLPGDEVLEIAGIKVPGPNDEETFDDLLRALPVQSNLDYLLRRDGQEMVINTAHPMPALVVQLAPQSAAYESGFRPGDVITHVNGKPILAFLQLQEAVLAAEGAPLPLTVWRDGEVMDFTLSAKRVDEPQPGGGFETNWRIGIVGGMLFRPGTETLPFGQAMNAGVNMTWSIISGSFSGLYHMASGAISSCNMSGPLGIAQVSGAMARQGLENFVYFIGILSTAVGLLNLFPIPVLDGGHLTFYAYEAVTRRKPSPRALKFLMTAGLTVILSLTVFALTNDLFCP
ncbi:Regulator of sigma E protease [Thalassovita autumnalis]|uniref:Zinc metalloprotease n=2 Tax=Thalassovita autumnalis TaxID=2072972 RepID=A0A0P1FN69_9RHOB|nr:RIP metalloprotease RseP [Thalassovita autumnalis]CUH69492.1 Regulator of sigma E protease [Thalassovita autumnalis]CUH72895.1 Regulator of sigma E protease [Thalassovita autumnalis]